MGGRGGSGRCTLLPVASGRSVHHREGSFGPQSVLSRVLGTPGASCPRSLREPCSPPGCGRPSRCRRSQNCGAAPRQQGGRLGQRCQPLPFWSPPGPLHLAPSSRFAPPFWRGWFRTSWLVQDCLARNSGRERRLSPRCRLKKFLRHRHLPGGPSQQRDRKDGCGVGVWAGLAVQKRPRAPLRGGSGVQAL